MYYEVVCEVDKKVVKLLTSARSRPDEWDIEPFHTEINCSTALAAATVQGSTG